MVDETRPGRSASGQDRSGIAWSVAIHVAIAIAIAVAMRGFGSVAVYRLPGTAEGVESLTYYSPGNSRSAAAEVPVNAVNKPKSAMSVHAASDAVKVASAPAAGAEQGAASAAQSGLGDGDITIALEKYFPYPTPSLSSMAQGTAGDVILKAVIDEHGRISQLTLLAGLGPAIDDEVIQTVNRWVYIPAMKDGVPVASVEELHFHYERRG